MTALSHFYILLSKSANRKADPFGIFDDGDGLEGVLFQGRKLAKNVKSIRYIDLIASRLRAKIVLFRIQA